MAKVERGTVRNHDGVREDTIWTCQDKPGHKFIRLAGEANVSHDIHILVWDEVKVLNTGKCPLC